MKRMTLSLLALAISFGIVQAQVKTTATPKEKGKQFQRHHDKPGIRHRGETMYYKKLNLSDNQQQKVKSINEDFRSKISDLHKQEDTITAKEYREQMKALNKERHEKLQALLTPDQQKQLATMKAGTKKRFEARSEHRMENMKKNLQLTDDQSAKMHALRTETKSKIKSIREDQSLTDEQKKAQVMAVLKKQHEEMNSLLTPDQIKKMKMLRPKHIQKGVR